MHILTQKFARWVYQPELLSSIVRIAGRKESAGLLGKTDNAIQMLKLMITQIPTGAHQHISQLESILKLTGCPVDYAESGKNKLVPLYLPAAAAQWL